MAKKINFTPETILNVKFSPKEKGYDSLEVDKIFDGIIADYVAYNEIIEELSNVKNKQQSEIEKLKEELEKCKIEFANLKKQFDAIRTVNGVNEDNLKLVKKIAAYERALYKKGVDPKKALSDPDNC